MPSCCNRSAVVGTQIKPRPKLRHEIDGGGRGVLRGHDKVAFVFAVGVVHDDDHFAFAEVGDDGFDVVEQFFSFGEDSVSIRRANSSRFNFVFCFRRAFPV